MMRAHGEGHRVVLVTCTRGEEGEIHNMDEAATRPRLAAVRTVELPDTASHGTALLGDPTAISVIDRAVRFLRDAMA